VRVHISAKWNNLHITIVKCRSIHRRAPPFLSHRVHTRNDGQNDQSLNLLQSSLRSHLAEIKQNKTKLSYDAENNTVVPIMDSIYADKQRDT